MRNNKKHQVDQTESTDGQGRAGQGMTRKEKKKSNSHAF
jgi:hypothetical protein